VLVEAVMVAVVVERANARAKATATDVCLCPCARTCRARATVIDQRRTGAWRSSRRAQGPQGARTKVAGGTMK
jgi:hypothetical protein